MEDNLDTDIVIVLPDNEKHNFIDVKTFTSQALKVAIIEVDDCLESLINDGVRCKVLAPRSDWQTGSIRLVIEFLPDKPMQDTEMEKLRQSLNQ